MSGRFAGLRQKAQTPPPPEEAVVPKAGRTPRDGKKAVVGYFSPPVSRALHLLALDNDTTIQGMLGEAIDDLMRKYDRHPFGER